jgi:hypothetical protein
VTVKDVSLVGFCWGDFWERFGKQWVECVEQLDPQPERILLFTDRKVDLPSGWEQRLTGHKTIWGFANDDVPTCGTEYAAILAMDDLMPSDSLADLHLGADVIASGHKDTLGNINIPTRERYENCLDELWYPLSGYHVTRSDLTSRIPLRPVDWADWIAMFEWYQHNISIHFDGRIRQFYTIRDGQYSQPKKPNQARANINLMRDLIRGGGVVPGAVWPPVPL